MPQRGDSHFKRNGTDITPRNAGDIIVVNDSAGTDEMDISHNGTDGKINNLVGELDTDTADGVYNFGLNEATDSIIKVWDSDKIRYIQISHNSSVANITASAGDIAINPSGDSIVSFGESHAVDTKIRVYDSDKTDYIEITHNSTNAQVGSNAGGILLNPETGLVSIYKSLVDSILRIYDSDVTDYLQLTHNSTNGIISTNVGDIIFSPTTNQLTIGTGAVGVDYILKFDGETNDGTITFMEDEARFDFSQPIKISNIKSGATQAAAGAAADEVWKTATHATLPDNVLMIGV